MNPARSTPRRRTLIVAALVLALAVAAVAGYAVLGGKIRSRLAAIPNLAFALADSGRVRAESRGEYTNLVFLHHSVGHKLLAEGGVREGLAEAGLHLWDQGYTVDGLRRPTGDSAGYSYLIPRDNTDPDGLARLFAQRLYSLPVNGFSALMQHEVIVFKSCFPVSQITSDEQLALYQGYYRSIRDVMDRYPNKLFVVVTQPPLNPADTTPSAAARARALADWLGSADFLGGRPNVRSFDLFARLAESDPASPERNMLRAAYRDGADSHPNRAANETIGPALVDFLTKAVAAYRAVPRV